MTSSDLRMIARSNLAGNWVKSALVAFIASLLGGALYGESFSISIDDDLLVYLPTAVRYYLLIAATIGFFFSILHFIIGGTVRLGYCAYLLKQYDGQDPELEDLFSQFHRFGDGFCLALLEGIYIFLWTLLFIIPGIIASLRYAMAPFIMVENPYMTASEAITASKRMMEGNKARLFCLQLSFIGWSFLCVFTLGIGYLFLNPYMEAATAAFYRKTQSITK